MTNSNKPGILFWIVGVVALLWNGMGVYNYLIQAYETEAYTSQLDNDAKIALMDSLPSWNTALFAIAVFAGLLGSILFLMRKKLAVPVLAISFLAAVITQLYWLFGTNATEVFADNMPYLIPVLVIVIATFLVWYSKDQRKNGVLS